jgi:hypothetical protein
MAQQTAPTTATAVQMKIALQLRGTLGPDPGPELVGLAVDVDMVSL